MEKSESPPFLSGRQKGITPVLLRFVASLLAFLNLLTAFWFVLVGQEKRAQRLTFWVRRPPGGVGVFPAKGWWPKSSCPPSKVCLPWVSKRGIWDVPGILPGCPGPPGVFKKFVQKKFVRIFRSLSWPVFSSFSGLVYAGFSSCWSVPNLIFGGGGGCSSSPLPYASTLSPAPTPFSVQKGSCSDLLRFVPCFLPICSDLRSLFSGFVPICPNLLRFLPICFRTKSEQERKSSPKSKFWGRISGGRPRGCPGGRPGPKTSVKPLRNPGNPG